MANLDTKTLSELDTITEMGENDKVLIESGGRMKKFSGTISGGGNTVLTETSGSIGVSYDQIVSYVSEGNLPILLCQSSGTTEVLIHQVSAYSIYEGTYFVFFTTFDPNNMQTSLRIYSASSSSGILTLLSD